MQNAFQRTHRSRMNSSSARVNTLPVGLFGVLRIIALVCGPNAAASSFSSYDQKEFSLAGGRILTKRGVAPMKIPFGRMTRKNWPRHSDRTPKRIFIGRRSHLDEARRSAAQNRPPANE